MRQLIGSFSRSFDRSKSCTSIVLMNPGTFGSNKHKRSNEIIQRLFKLYKFNINFNIINFNIIKVNINFNIHFFSLMHLDGRLNYKAHQLS